jgi:hypothetical protein
MDDLEADRAVPRLARAVSVHLPGSVIIARMEEASDAVAVAIGQLTELRREYETCDLPSHIRSARVAALNPKIAALQAVYLDPHAYPWMEDTRG